MASVSSLDQDMRKLRLDRVTTGAEDEVRAFIEAALGKQEVAQQFAQNGLFDTLRDGIVLCELVNTVITSAGPGYLPVRYKRDTRFQFRRENISQFIEACQRDPIKLQSHDVFLTVDLEDSKDLAQVLQCLGAFSRAAHRIDPSKFPNPIGGKSRRSVLGPQRTGGAVGERARGFSNASPAYSSGRPAASLTPTQTGDSNSGRWSPTKTTPGPLSPSSASSASKKSDGSAAPWSEAQYGYMRGANQGSLGVSFGGRRQITSAGPHIPSVAEKTKLRKEREEEEERLKIEDERRRHEEQEAAEARVRAEEERARIDEEQRWAEETRKMKEKERLEAEEEKRKWEDEERRWKLEEERRQQEEREAEAIQEEERKKVRGRSDSRLQGQFLSQYQAEHSKSGNGEAERSRVEELERELELAREREREYQREREARSDGPSRQDIEAYDLTVRVKERKARSRSRSRPRPTPKKDADEAWREDERDYLRKQWGAQNHDGLADVSPPPRPLPEPTPAPVRVKTNHTGPSSRPLPDPAKYASPKEPAETFSPPQNRTDRYLSSNPAPQQPQPRTTYSKEIGGFDSAAERDAEDQRRIAAQTATKAGGWASKSLLEREMENERLQQQEWEERHNINRTVGTSATPDASQRSGYGGDGQQGQNGQNRGSQGSGAGRRQVFGPRPPPPGR